MVHAGRPFSQPTGSHADEGPASGCQDQCPLLGDLYGGGVTYGYSFVLSRRWSLETTLGVGMAHVQEMSWDKDEYEPGEANVKGWRPIPIKAGVTFVYLIK